MPSHRHSTPSAAVPTPTPADVVLDRANLVPPTLALGAPVFWEKYKAAILGVAALVALGLLGTAVSGNLKARKQAEASAALAAAKTPEDYQRVMDAYAGTDPAANAALLLAHAQREKGDSAGAEKTLRAFMDKFPQHPFAGGALLALAADLQARGQADPALALYQQTADRYPRSYSAPLALFAKAELLRIQGKTEDARRTFETLIATHGQSISAQQATQALRYLRGPAPAQTAPPAALSSPPAVTAPAPTAGTSPAAPAEQPAK